MKKVISILFVYTIALIISSCGNKAKDSHSGTHVHEDGTVHKDGDHDHAEHQTAEQESYVVEGDSTEVNEHEHDHDHQH